jgi:hypothetical protein
VAASVLVAVLEAERKVRLEVIRGPNTLLIMVRARLNPPAVSEDMDTYVAGSSPNMVKMVRKVKEAAVLRAQIPDGVAAEVAGIMEAEGPAAPVQAPLVAAAVLVT